MSIVRLFLDSPLAEQGEIALEREQAHYLFNVMRLSPGATIHVFNGQDGEWETTVIEAGKKRGLLQAVRQRRPQSEPPDIELIFAPIKKARTDFIVEKACELGCRRIRPVFTRHTNSERLNLPRLAAHMVEAAEQCDGLSVPVLEAPQKLTELLAQWGERKMIFCDEARSAPEISVALADLPSGTPISILIGPEGGFSPDEVKSLRSMACVIPVSLGPRILRADTAAVAAITAVQSAIGDWKSGP